MPLIRRANRNGHAAAATIPVGTAPSTVGSLTAGTPTTTTIPVTYTAATGTATITYAGETSLDGTTWTSNGGTFNSTGGTFSGLASATAYYLRIVASNGFGSSRTLLAGTVSTAAATTYTVAISPSSGVSGSTFSYTATPATGGWPAGEVITPTVTGGTVSPTSATGSGTTPVVFTVTATGSAGTNCIVNSTAPGMANSTGAETYAITNPATLAANRYDILTSNASGDTSTARTVSVVPNALWGGDGTKAITLTASKAGGGTSSVGTITLPSSGGATQTVSWTPPSAGEWTIGGTNTASMNNPFSPLYVTFAAASGTAQSISANSSYFLDQQPFQQDAWSGTPAGWTAAGGATFGMGWGAFQVKVTPGGSSAALYGQLFDSDSSGASTTANTGTAVSNAAQIYGAVAGGSEIAVNVNLPSSDVTYYLDVATDSAMTNRARIPMRFRITDVVAISSRSMECMWMQDYGYSSAPGTTWSSYTKTLYSYSPGASSYAGSWTRADGVNSGPVGAMEAGRRFAAKKGHGCALVGLAEAGGNMNWHWSETDGSPCFGFGDAVSKLSNGKFRYLKTLENEWNTGGATESYAEYQDIIGKIINYMTTHYPALAVIAFGTSSGQFGQNGSSAFGYTRINKIVTDQIEPINPMVIGADAGPDWDEWGGNAQHATRASQTRFIRSGVMTMLMAEGAHAGGYGLAPADRFVTFSKTGTVSGDNIYVPFTLPAGATGLVTKKWLNGTSSAGWTYSTPSALELCNIVAAYAGSGTHWAGGTPVLLTSVVVDNANKRLILTLDRSGGAGTIKYFNNGGTASQPSAFTVQLFSDFQINSSYDSSYGVGIFDDRSTLDDYGFGAHARPQLDVVCS